MSREAGWIRVGVISDDVLSSSLARRGGSRCYSGSSGKGSKSGHAFVGLPPPDFFFHFTLFLSLILLWQNKYFAISSWRGWSHYRCLGVTACRCGSETKNEMTTLGGGSLGSCVDEERSQLRELM